MDKVKEFLLEINQGAKMGVDSIKLLIPKCTEANLKNELKNQKKEYENIIKEINESLDELGVDEKNPSIFAQAGAWMNIQVGTLFNKSASFIAEKLMGGNLMGVIGITKIINKNKTVLDESHLKYAEKFIDICEQNIKNLKEFLI